MISILLTLLLPLPSFAEDFGELSRAATEGEQDGQVKNILDDFDRDRAAARSQDQYNKAVGKCIAGLETYVDQNPKAEDAPRGLAALGDLYNHIGNCEKAEAAYQRIIKDYPDAEQVAPAILSIAELALRNENDKKAAEYCSKFLEKHKDHKAAPYARLFLSLTLLYRGKSDQAIRELESLRKDIKGETYESMIATQLAVVYHLSGRQKEAQAVVEELILASKDEKQSEHLRRLLSGYLLVESEAPDFEKDGFTLKDEKGGVVVLYFFYSNSSLTEGELNFLKELHDKMKEKPVKLVGVSLDPLEREFDTFKRLTEVPWTLVRDGNRFRGDIARKFNVKGLPHLIVVDKKGVIRFYNVSGRDLRLAVQTLLDEK